MKNILETDRVLCQDERSKIIIAVWIVYEEYIVNAKTAILIYVNLLSEEQDVEEGNMKVFKRSVKGLFSFGKASFGKLGLRKTIIGIVLLFFFIAVVLATVTSCIIIERNTAQTVERSLSSMNEQRKNALETYFQQMKDVAITTCYSNWLQTLFARHKTYYEMQKIQDNVMDFLSGLESYYDGAKFVVWLDNENRIKSHSTYYLDYSIDLTEKEWYPELEEKGKYVEIGTGTGIYKEKENWSVNLYYQIRNNSTLDQEGILVTHIPEETVRKYLDTNFEGSYAELYDEEGKRITGTLPEYLLENRDLQTEEKELSVFDTKWKIVVYLDKESLVVNQDSVWTIYLFVVMMAVVLFWALAVVFSRYLMIPILRCRDAMTEIRNNHMGIQVEHSYQNELGELMNGFNEMSASIGLLIEKNKTISLLQKETEYQMLLQQINPHFLYNTLELINGLILSGEREQAVRVCETLGQIFRYNLKRDKWVQVQEELDYIKQYLQIMKCKVRNLSVYYEVEAGVVKKKILKSVLQPLVENSIRHGLVKQYQDSCITVMIENLEEGIGVMIMDNGVGISGERMKALKMDIDRIRENPVQKSESSAHIGVLNVFQRLYLEYGERMHFNISAREGAGTKIQIVLPEGGEDV